MDLSELQRALAERGSPWVAQRTPLLDMDPTKRRAVGIPESDAVDALRAASSNLVSSWPSKTKIIETVDWRVSRPALLGPVRDQLTCNSCAAFAVCSVMEAQLRSREQACLDLSEADLFFCGGGDRGSGMLLETALMRAKSHGVALEKHFPYDPAISECLAVNPAARLSGFQYITNERDRRLAISEDGPVIAVLRVYEDLIAYTSGVYEHISGAYEGLHAVAIVGYDEAERFWIARNSWGPGAGEGGYFRIRYGQCEIDTRPFVAVDSESVA